jgi:hypothetical protein
VAETPEKEPEAETLSEETQLGKEPVALNRRSGRIPAIVVSSLALTFITAVTLSALPEYNIALPNFSSFAELFPRGTASVPIPDPAISATLKDIQSAQQRNVAALEKNGATLQQNTGMLQQEAATLESLRQLQLGAATLESLRQGFTVQQTNLKTISNQLSSLVARVDSLQNAVTPLTTSSIKQPSARARLVRTSRKKTSRLPDEPVGPVSIGGAPLNPAPTKRSDAG